MADFRYKWLQVWRLSDTHKYVFVSGGIGPTHDDMTLEAIAKAFGCGLQVQEKREEEIKRL